MNQFPPPAYSEKASAGSSTFQASQHPTNSTLAQSLSAARTNRIEETIVTSIYPHLESSAHRGIARTTLVLLPKDLSTATLGIESKEQADAASVVGFPSDEFVQLIYLPHTAGTLEFWRQHNVVPDLASRLRSTLAAAGSNVRSDIIAESSPISTTVQIAAPSPSRGFFRRISAKSKPLPDVEGVDADINQTRPSLAPGEVDVSAVIQDVCFRVVTDMGLYETRTEKGVVVKMEIGT